MEWPTALITYYAMKMDLVARSAGIVISWTMSPVISGYLATGGMSSGAVIKGITVLATFLIYYPFVRNSDKEKLAAEADSESTEQLLA